MRRPSNRGWSARGAYDDRDLRVRAAQAAGLADGPRELRNRGAQPQAARTHLLGVGPDYGSGVYGAGLACGDLGGRIRRAGDAPLVAGDRRGAAESGRSAVPGIDRGWVAPARSA